MGKQSRKGKARVAPHPHHKAGEGVPHHHKHHEGPVYKAYHQHHHAAHDPINNNQNITTTVEEEKTEQPPAPPTTAPRTVMVTPEVEEDSKIDDDAKIEEIMTEHDDDLQDEDDRLIHELLDDFGVTVPPEVLNAKTPSTAVVEDDTAMSTNPNSLTIDSVISNDENDRTPVFLADLDEVLGASLVEDDDDDDEQEETTEIRPGKNIHATYNSNGQHHVQQQQQHQPSAAAKPPTRNSTKTFSNRMSAAGSIAGEANASLAKQDSQRKKPTPMEPFNLSSSNTFRLSHLEEPEQQSETKFKARPLPKTTHQPQQLRDIPPAETATSSLKMSRMRYSTPPRLSTAARASDREERAKHFREAAERARKERERQLRAHKKKVQLQRKQREELKAKRAAEAQKLKAPTRQYGQQGFRPTVCHPFALRSTVLHEQRLQEMRRTEEEKKKSQAQQQAQFKSRPVPRTTYESNRISTHETDTEWSRLYHKRRHEKLEELRKKEEEKKRDDEGENNFHCRKIPESTYKSPAKFDDSLRQVNSIRQIRIGEIRKQEEKKEEEEHHKFRARPVPKTTYEPSPVSVRDVHLVEELQACHSHDEDEKDEYEFHALPVPKTTYNPETVSLASRATSVSSKKKTSTTSCSKGSNVCVARALSKRMKAELSIETGEDEAPPVRMYNASSKGSGKSVDSAGQKMFHARPVPSSTYNPTWISPKQSSHKSPSSASSVISSRSTTSSVAATKSTRTPVKSRLTQETASSRTRMAQSRQKTSASSVAVASPRSFKARPAPKSTYQPPVSTRSTFSTRSVASTKSTASTKATRSIASTKSTASTRATRSVASTKTAPSTKSTRTNRSLATRKAAAPPVRAQKDNVKKATRPVSKPSASFTPVTPSRPVRTSASTKTMPKNSPRKLPAPRKLNATLAAESQTEFAPDNTKNSYAPSSKTAFTQEKPAPPAESGLFASSVAVGTIPTTAENTDDVEMDHAQQLADMLDKDPSAEITFDAWDDDDDALDALLDESPTGEITAEISFTHAADDDTENDQELSAILGGAALQTQQDDFDHHDAELDAILNF